MFSICSNYVHGEHLVKISSSKLDACVDTDRQNFSLQAFCKNYCLRLKDPQNRYLHQMLKMEFVYK